MNANDDDDEKCLECGRTRSEHHVFAPATLPRGCTCDPQEWAYPERVPPVCTRYEPMRWEPELCRNCEHSEKCHE